MPVGETIVSVVVGNMTRTTVAEHLAESPIAESMMEIDFEIVGNITAIAEGSISIVIAEGLMSIVVRLVEIQLNSIEYSL